MDWILKLLGSDGAKNFGSLLSGGAAAYGAYKQGQAADQIAKLQLRDYNEERDRRKRTQGRIDSSFARLPLY